MSIRYIIPTGSAVGMLLYHPGLVLHPWFNRPHKIRQEGDKKCVNICVNLSFDITKEIEFSVVVLNLSLCPRC